MPLGGRRMVEWSLAAFRACGSVRSIVVACPPGHLHDLAGGDLGVVDGGATRAESVSNALQAVGTELVAIHDAARPLVTPELIEGVIATLVGDTDADGAIAATPVTDTIKRAALGAPPDPGPAPEPGGGAGGEAGCNVFPGHSPGKTLHPLRYVKETVDRERLWAAQTPQVFRAEALRRAIDGDPKLVAAATDEATLIEAAGGRVLIHPAPGENVKVTTPFDLRLAELLLTERAAR